MSNQIADTTALGHPPAKPTPDKWDFLLGSWASPSPVEHPADSAGSTTWQRNRNLLSDLVPGQTVVSAAGTLIPRSNDTNYQFRPDSNFAWLTGETSAGGVLVMEPKGDGHQATLFVEEPHLPGSKPYFNGGSASSLWSGMAPDAILTSDALGIQTRPKSEFQAFLAEVSQPFTYLGPPDTSMGDLNPSPVPALIQTLDRVRLVKSDWEIGRIQEACGATARGFEDMVRELPKILAWGGEGAERWLEGTFWRRARTEGNDVGYSSIVSCGANGPTLHWWRKTGSAQPGDLLLADVGVESRSLYTADITRTIPIDGKWRPDQRRVYAAVLEAYQAGVAELKAGAAFQQADRAAKWVLADHLHSWGLLPVTADDSCHDDLERPGRGLHNRFTLHDTSHMLGLDVHDCISGGDDHVWFGTLSAGNVMTVEPGLYFQQNDLRVPPPLRGMAIRIEDDFAITEQGSTNLSPSPLPLEPDDVAAWVADIQGSSR